MKKHLKKSLVLTHWIKLRTINVNNTHSVMLVEHMIQMLVVFVTMVIQTMVIQTIQPWLIKHHYFQKYLLAHAKKRNRICIPTCVRFMIISIITINYTRTEPLIISVVAIKIFHTRSHKNSWLYKDKQRNRKS